MRTIVDLPDVQIHALDDIGGKLSLSRAELVRRAVADYLDNQHKGRKQLLDKYFGMLKGSDDFDGMGGVEWQKQMRAEWDEREVDIDRRLVEARGLHDHPQRPYDAK